MKKILFERVFSRLHQLLYIFNKDCDRNMQNNVQHDICVIVQGILSEQYKYISTPNKQYHLLYQSLFPYAPNTDAHAQK